MAPYKVNSAEDNRNFIVTSAYHKIYDLFKDLKNRKGRIIHILGAPGTGKSANIYEAMFNLDLNIYEAFLLLEDVDKSSGEVYREFFNTLKRDMGVKQRKDLYLEASKYDAILFADKFHDSHLLHKNKVGFSLWADNKGFRTLPFYLRIILDYIRHIKDFRSINLIFQTAWTIKVKGVKKDLFSDFGLFSKVLVGLLKLFFEVVEVSYYPSEIIEIIKKHNTNAGEDEIKICIEKYGDNIRYILQSLKEEKESL